MPTILGANTLSGEYDVANSLRFNDGSSDYLSKTFGTATNRKKWTFSAWIKRSNPTTNGEAIFGGLSEDSTSWYSRLADNGDGRYDFTEYSGSAYTINLRPNPLQRDASAWYHFVLMYDSAQSTASNRVKYYINGSQVTSFATEVYPSQNQESGINKNHLHRIGQTSESGSSYYFDGYMAEVVFCDGQAYSPTDFGEFDSDSPSIWKPKDVSGLTFGNNGFYLDFENSGSLGADVSGNSNDFTVTNLVATDQSTDTCTNNFCTLNPFTLQSSNYVLSEGNLKISIGDNDERKAALGTFGLTTGKWYWEVKYVSTTGQAYSQIGISDIIQGTEASTENGKMGYQPYDYGYRGERGSGSGGIKTNNGTYTVYGDAWTTGDIIGVALDLDNNAIYFSKNGTFQAPGAVGDPTSGASRTNATFNITAASSTNTGAYFPAIGKEDADDPVFEFNFGGTNSASFAISSGNTDGKYGNFEYAPPSGYYALCTKRLAEFG